MSGKERSSNLVTAARWIADADGILIAAGAGMGVDSGLPDFRGKEGFWRAYPVLKEAGVDFHNIANPRAFREQPELAWGFYGHRLDLYRNTRPHEGFQILRRWASSKPHGCRVFTSNVDGQFQRAGFVETEVYECHGSIHWLQCSRLCGAPPRSADTLEVKIDTRSCKWTDDLPKCPKCRGLLRPAILMFNDFLWESSLFEEKLPGLQAWLKQVPRLVVIEVGAGLAISTVRQFSETSAAGGKLVRINPRDAKVVGENHVGIDDGALAALSAIEETPC